MSDRKRNETARPSRAKRCKTSATVSRTGSSLLCFIVFVVFAATAGAQDPFIGPQVRIDTDGGTYAANETSASSASMNPFEVVAAWNDWRGSLNSMEFVRMGVGVSLDGGQTWTDFLVRPPDGHHAPVEGDPMTAHDPRTGAIWVGAISFVPQGGVFVARKDPNSTTFQPSVLVGQKFFADKGWMAAGSAPSNPNSTNLYVAVNEGVWRSTDMGDSWMGPVPFPLGAGLLPRVGPDGELYVTYWDFGDQHLIRRSFDGGQTFGDPVVVARRLDVWGIQDGSRFPGQFRVPPFNALAVNSSNGDLYVVYPDTTGQSGANSNVDLYFTRSNDQGTNWSLPVALGFDLGNPGD